MFRNNHDDQTMNREYLKRVKVLAAEYELVKAKNHPRFKFASDLFRVHKIPRQTFYKIYRRLQLTGSPEPGKRGPKNPHKQAPAIINAILRRRQNGFSRFEIHSNLLPVLKHLTPSQSTIYNICRTHNLNRLQPKQKRCKRMIIKEKAGELLHMDCYHLPKGIVKDAGKKLYLIGGIDDATRLAWVEVMPDITALSAMFSGMQVLRLLQDRYNIETRAVLTDNGSEFKGKDVLKHPFERLLSLLQVKHYYTKPYKPQTNGKIERFWKTLYEDLLCEAEFESSDALRDELLSYLIYYNEHRPHQSIDNKTPNDFNQFCPRIP